MKKLTSLLLLIAIFLSNISLAQNTACNAEFNVVYQNGNTIQFNPQVTGDPANTNHYWLFGDGNQSNAVSPAHTYLFSGVYSAEHIIIRYVNGVQTCIDSFFRVVQIQGPCNITASFTATPIGPNAFHFQNTSTPNVTDSIHWTFGDGTSSNDVNPSHTYAQQGTYIVCLRIQQMIAGTATNCISEICDSIVVQNPTSCTLQANFYSYQDTTTANPFTWQFVNTSTPLNNTDSIRWTFGDGTASSDVNPTHTYAQQGTYTVCLRVQKRDSLGLLTNCISEICHVVNVVQDPNICYLVAGFYFYPDSLSTVPNVYHFINTSTPLNSTDSIRWTFGDGISSHDVNPTHTYAQPGTYTVCLRVQKRDSLGGLTDCIRETCHTIVIQNPNPCTLVADFYAYHDSSSTTVNVYHFVNTSAPLNNTDSIRWTFGDGTSSNDINPTHTYAQPGTYTVCLRVQKRDSTGTLLNCVSEICHVVVVSTTCNTAVHFSWSADSINNRKIIFTNLTVSPTASATATWFFGDGTSATSWNAVHEYAQPGNYSVCLRVQFSPNCVVYSCDSITVHTNEVNCIQQSNFNVLSVAGNSQLFYFIPAHVNNNWQYTWTFGDGTGNHNITTSHHYTQPGNYTACLTVYRNANCASTSCKPVHVTWQQNCDSAHVNYTYQSYPGFPNKFYFHAVSNYTIIDQTWTITKLPASSTTQPVILHQNNPAYIFNDTGYYRVCLRATTLGGCIKEYCQEINVSQVIAPNTCTLQAYPNPGTNTISVNVFLNQPQMIHVYIYNTMNVQVKEKHQQGFSGNNIVSIGIGDLVPGTYTMKVIHGNDICYAQFVKL